jgi:heat shock protein HslJ
MIRYLFIFLLTTLIACSPRYATQPETKNSALFGTWWRVEAIDGREAAFLRGQRRDMHIILYSSRKMVGSGGCNQISGSFIHSPGSIRFGAIASSKMMCKPEVMARERAFIAALRKADSFIVRGRRLTMFDRSGRRVLRFMAVPSR